VELRYQEGPSSDHYNAGNHDLCPISGRPWQMRAGGEYLQLAQRAAPDAKRCSAATVPVPAPTTTPPTAKPGQLELFV